MLLKSLLALMYSFLFAVGLSLALNRITPLVSPYWAYGLVVLIPLYLILNFFYMRQASSETFTQLLIAGIVIKLLVAMVAVLVYSLIDKSGLFHFSIHFMLHYILFTIFEIRYLQYIIKTHR